MQQVKGCGVALITPFHKSGAVDYMVFRRLIKRQIQNGANFLVPFGTSGEAACLADEEKFKLLEAALDEVDGKIPVFAGIISNTTPGAINAIKLLEKLRPDGFLVITPYYNKPMPSGLYYHFKAVALTTDKPILLYNLPSNTSVNLDVETCLKLAEIKNIIGVKDGSGNYSQISEIIRNAPENFVVFSGKDKETLALMATGAKGVIGGTANVAPKEISTLTKALLRNDFITARKIHHQLSPLFTSLSLESNPIMVKAAMHKMGLIENVLRSPLYPATRKNTKIIVKVLEGLDLIK